MFDCSSLFEKSIRVRIFVSRSNKMSAAEVDKICIQLPRIEQYRLGKHDSPRTASRASSMDNLTKASASAESKKPLRIDNNAFIKASAKVPDNARAVYSTDPNRVSLPVFGWFRVCLFFKCRF